MFFVSHSTFSVTHNMSKRKTVPVHQLLGFSHGLIFFFNFVRFFSSDFLESFSFIFFSGFEVVSMFSIFPHRFLVFVWLVFLEFLRFY